MRSWKEIHEELEARKVYLEQQLVEAVEKDPERYTILLRRFRSGFVNLEYVRKRLRLEKYDLIKNPVTDLEIIEHLWASMCNGDCSSPTIIRPSNVWNFNNPRVGFGSIKDYDPSADIIFNLLYFFTKQGDLIVDPMAIGGVVGDVCKVVKRNCRMFGINPIRDDVERWDIRTQGFPIEGADLVFLNPGRLNYDFKAIAEDLHKHSKKVALLITEADKNRFVWEYVNIFEEADWRELCEIQCPLSKSRYNEEQLEKARHELKILPLARSLVIFEREDLK